MCGGTDVLSAMAAFPHAQQHLIISSEPMIGTEPVQSPLPFELKCHMLQLFRSFHGEDSDEGPLVRSFASRWGVLPILLGALYTTGFSVHQIVARRIGSLRGVQLTCTRSIPQQSVNVSYIQADVMDITAVSNLKELQMRKERVLTGGVLKRTRAFCNWNASAYQTRETALQQMIRMADVLLLDLQSGVQWPLIKEWAGRGWTAFEENLPRAILQEVDERKGSATQTSQLVSQQSLQGYRFQSCNQTAYVSGMSAWFGKHNRSTQIVTRSDIQRAPQLHCGAVLAWRCQNPGNEDMKCEV
eukprot:CAMPEP_0119326782 /NCGR_PEP_ID=MMETSP1333-20130426/69285_1 /TAXON_ID=418940 /ORGANISM="Scyphosphaera apsteinii, Strain RCC1455" /LENGTH=299 /DNA_ID=CAMNT_0007335193 /DNA_START=725 /DNA_END=1627 /DNA_ORIENTATION=-